MKRYFRASTDSPLGTGTIWYEFDDVWALRQVQHYGNRWFNSLSDHSDEIGQHLTDLPLTELLPDLQAHEIDEAEFERAWHASLGSDS